jgi:predicted lysophospholipase L1 biosynthesis ABC-type transport system permease subunit
MIKGMTLSSLYRTTLLLAVSLTVAGCEAIANIFQGGIVVGVIVVLLVLGVIAWVMRKAGGTPRS